MNYTCQIKLQPFYPRPDDTSIYLGFFTPHNFRRDLDPFLGVYTVYDAYYNMQTQFFTYVFSDESVDKIFCHLLDIKEFRTRKLFKAGLGTAYAKGLLGEFATHPDVIAALQDDTFRYVKINL